MFKCSRLCDKATANDETQIPISIITESVQLCHNDPENVPRFFQSLMKKLENQLVQVRIKALKLLLYISVNGPSNVRLELKQYTGQLYSCIEWRGMPHPSRGYSAYDEMKSLAQQLLDFISITPNDQLKSYYIKNISSSISDTHQGVGGSRMQSYSSSLSNQASFESKTNRPNAIDYIDNVLSHLPFGKKNEQQTVHGSFSDDISTPNLYSDSSNSNVKMSPSTQRSFSQEKKSILAASKNSNQKSSFSPVSKLLKISGSRAVPNDNELSAFSQRCKGKDIKELEQGLKNDDWKVKVRSLYGLDICGQKYGYGSIAHLKVLISSLIKSHQSSLRASASKLYGLVEQVDPTGIPQEEDEIFIFDNVSHPEDDLEHFENTEHVDSPETVEIIENVENVENDKIDNIIEHSKDIEDFNTPETVAEQVDNSEKVETNETETFEFGESTNEEV